MIKCRSYNLDVLRKLTIEEHNQEWRFNLGYPEIDNCDITNVNRYSQTLHIINIDYIITPSKSKSSIISGFSDDNSYECVVDMNDYTRELRAQKLDKLIVN